jgi:hypothetical protein
MPLRLQPGGREPGTHYIAGWLSPRAGLESMKKGESLALVRESNPSRPACGLVAVPTEPSRLRKLITA